MSNLAAVTSPTSWTVTVRRHLTVRTVILVLLLIGGLIGPWVVPYDPLQPDPFNTLQPPSSAHWFGTDRLGMDVFSRVIVAIRVDFSIALVGVLIGGTIGSVLGALAAYVRGPLEALLLRSVEVLQSFPVLLLGIALFVALGQGVTVMIVAIVAVNVPLYLRHVRSVILPMRTAPYIQAARCAGYGPWGIVWRHLLPNAKSQILGLFPLTCGYAIQLIAGLSFIGLGIEPPEPEWGSMINAGASQIVQGVWWPSVFPGLALVLSVYALSGLSEQKAAVDDVHGV